MSAKGELINRLRHLGLGAPHFDVQQNGPAHDPHFRAEVLVDGRTLAYGEGRTKRDAERAASEAALDALEVDDHAALQTLPVDDRRAADEDEDGTTWPIYADVLASALQVAHGRVPHNASIHEVRDAAARLYADLLTELGHRPERA